MTLIFTSNVAGGNLQLTAPRATPRQCAGRCGTRTGNCGFLAFPSASRVYGTGTHTRHTFLND